MLGSNFIRKEERTLIGVRAPLPSTRSRRREAEEEDDGEVAGPSHPSRPPASPPEVGDEVQVEGEEELHSPPPAPEEEEEEVPYCPQEVISELGLERKRLQGETNAEIQYMKKRMEKFERKQKQRVQKLMDLQKKVVALVHVFF
ncbi:uncharacterized protein LOC130291421 [Hyla sarda]|uniref:uncharacterized protein LOC130291421 n=1 Tax=Hyla sarda TaxID=327740 RepID=UPI0024C35CEB|nr:uncharacterized protein LOC130291421 [Hyla sarda]